jgi:glycosyltransferase involved in cell wall biosynthesis/SAM-dependent methyltransferase
MITETGQNLAFLLGLPRSGTTLLGAMLGQHSQIACPPEPWMMLALDMLAQTSHRNPAGSQALGEAFREFCHGEASLAAKRAFALSAYNQKLAETGKSFLIDKTPRYFLILPSIRQLFPDARWLWLTRNPLAIAASYKTTWGVNIPRLLAAREDHWAYFDFIIGLNRLLAFAAAMGPALLSIQYEAMVANPEPILAQVLDHLNLPQEQGLSHFDLTGSDLVKAYAGDKKIVGTHQPHTNSIAAWEEQFSVPELQVLLDSIGLETFNKLGYANVVDRIAALGARYSGTEQTAAWLRRGETALADRRTDIDIMSSNVPHAVVAARLGANNDDVLDGSQVKPGNPEHAARGKLSAMTRMSHRLRRRLAQTREASLQLAASISARDGEIASLQTQLEMEASEVKALSTALAGREAELAATRAEQETILSSCQLLSERNAALADESAQVQQEMEFAAAALDEKERTCQTLAAEAGSLRQARDLLAVEKETWRGQAGHYESLLQRIDRMRWYERLYDTAGRIALNVIVGRQYAMPTRVRPLPKLSIVTPVYNGQDHIREAILSVLSQNYPNLEYIVVDGGSTDDTMKIVNEYAPMITRVISEPDNGMYDAIAKGILAATGDICGYLNSDDMYEPGGLLRVGEYFRDHPRAAVIYHEDTVTVNGWRFPNIGQPHVDLYHLLNRHVLFQDGVFFKRDAFWAVGGVNRGMRLAGDWDLWIRLSRRFKLRRVDGHVSSFRVRAGQLTTDMKAYNAELERARDAFCATFGLAGRVRCLPRHLLNGLRNAMARRFKRRAKFFPIDFPNMPPPPGESRGFVPGQPICPLTGERPDRLLFSTRDTRFGDQLINYVYYDSKSDVALAYPPLTAAELGVLYERHYSNPDSEIILAAEGRGSPYRHYRGGGRFARYISRCKVPYKLIGRLLGPWKDKTGEELLAILERLVPRRGGQISLLDVGCFDGKLLDELKESTDFQLCGLEPNAKAAEAARTKGHRVWTAGAEDAPFAVPDGTLFNVIFLGQTIEHVQDPPNVLRRLSGLLAPGGCLVLSTPNLDSKQIELFGPTWAHWHLPYHRTLFSRRSLRKLASLASLRVVRSATYSHPYWTALSLQLNDIGLGGAVPHGQATLPEKYIYPAQCLVAWSKMLWDWRGGGDYIYVVLKKVEVS